MTSLEFKVVVDAIKIPPSASPSFRYQVTWHAGNSGDAEGRTAIVAAAGHAQEVAFHHNATFRTPNPPDRLLQLSVVQYRPLVLTPRHVGSVGLRRSSSVNSEAPDEEGSEKKVVGVLVIDLNAHVPKTNTVQSRQRASLAVSLCPFDPPIMIRLAVESTRSHASYIERSRYAPSSQRRSASRSSHVDVNQTTLGDGDGGDSGDTPRSEGRPMVVGLTSPEPSAPNERMLLDDVQMDLARMKAAVSTLTAANQQLRDENVLLRTAVQKAREEPQYTYTAASSIPIHVHQSADASHPGTSAGSRRQSNAVTPVPPSNDVVAVLEAEIAVLQRGLQAAKAKLREKDETEHDLHAEIESLTMANQFQAEDISRLDEELKRAKSEGEGTAPAVVEELKRSLAEMQAKTRMLTADLKSEEHIRSKINEELRILRQDYEVLVRRRDETESQHTIQLDSAKQMIQVLEGRLAAARSDVEALHQRSQEADARCQAVARIVESQATILTNKNNKIKTLQSLLEATDVLKRHNSSSNSPSRSGSAAPNKAATPTGSSRISAPTWRPPTPKSAAETSRPSHDKERNGQGK